MILGYASGRAFLTLGQALGDYLQRQEAQEREDRILAEERAEREATRRANVLMTPGAYESPTTRLRVDRPPPTLDVPDLPSFPTSLSAGPRGFTPEAARATLDLPDAPTAELPEIGIERTRLPEGHTRPLSGIAFNPLFAEEQERQRNREFAEDVTESGLMDPERAALLEHTGPRGFTDLMPPPDEPTSYQFRETAKGIVGFDPSDPTNAVETGYLPPPSARERSESEIAAAKKRAAMRDVQMMLTKGNFDINDPDHRQVIVRTMQTKYPELGAELPEMISEFAGVEPGADDSVQRARVLEAVNAIRGVASNRETERVLEPYGYRDAVTLYEDARKLGIPTSELLPAEAEPAPEPPPEPAPGPAPEPEPAGPVEVQGGWQKRAAEMKAAGKSADEIMATLRAEGLIK